MRKGHLLTLPVPEATEAMYRAAAGDRREKQRISCGWERYYWKYGFYFNAGVRDGILIVSAYTRKVLREKGRTPAYVFYFSKEEDRWFVRVPEKEAWLKGMLQHYEYQICDSWYMDYRRHWETRNTLKTISNYLGIEGKDTASVIRQWQDRQKARAKETKWKRYFAGIDAVMDQVPPLPKDFERWVEKYGLEHHIYLFYAAEGRRRVRVNCSCCGRSWTTDKLPHHNKSMTCRFCRMKGIAKAERKQKYLRDDSSVSILQRMPEGYVIRIFAVGAKREWNEWTGWRDQKLSMMERERYVLSGQMVLQGSYYYDFHIPTQKARWNSQGFSGYSMTIPYTRNLRRVLRDRPYGKYGIRALLKGDERVRINLRRRLEILERYPYLEYVDKAGLHRLLDEILHDGYGGRNITTDPAAVRLQDLLMITGQRLHDLKIMDGGTTMLRAMQWEKETGNRLTERTLRFLQEYNMDIYGLHEPDGICGMTGMNINRMVNYLQRQMEETGQSFQTVCQVYSDYLDMAAERGMDLHDEIVCHTPKLRYWHDRYVEEQNRKRDAEHDRQMNKRYPRIAKNAERNRKHFEWNRSGVMIMAAARASDITREGRRQHHCVGGKQYLEKMDQSETFILFLRRQSSKSKPWYTVEAKWDGTIIQAYAAYDRKPDYEEVERILKAFTAAVRKRTEKEDQVTLTEQQIPKAAAG